MTTYQDKITNLQDYFNLIRKRPGMYLGSSTITRLNHHLAGYGTAIWIYNLNNPIDKHFFDDFNDFIYKYYGLFSNENWHTIILAQNSGHEQNALNKFFELFDLFIAEKKSIDSKQVVLELFNKLVFKEEEILNKLGKDYHSILNDTFELIEDKVFSEFKNDYDEILEQLKEKPEQSQVLIAIIKELEIKHTK